MRFSFLIILFTINYKCSFSQTEINNKADIFCSYKKLLHEIKNLKINKVEVFNFNCNQKKQEIFDYKLVVDSNKKIAPTASNRKVLTDAEKTMLLKIINTKDNYITNIPESKGCYNPRMGFIFYDSSNSIIAHFDICLECDQILFESYPNNFSCQTDFYDSGKRRFKYLCKYFKLECCK